MPRRHFALSVLLILLGLAGGLRIWSLETLPPGLYHDEAYNGLDAQRLLQGGTFPYFHEGWELYRADAYATALPRETRWPVFFEGNYGREPLHVYLMALSIAVFGPTPFAVRLVPALAGVLAVFACYLAASVLLPQRWQPGAALVAAAMLAIAFPAVHFSRFGIRGMLFLPVATLCVYSFWQGAAALAAQGRHARLWFAVAGFWLGLGLYTYSVARLFPLVFALFLPLWLGRTRAFWCPRLAGLALMAGVSMVVAAPLLLFFWRYPFYFTFRAGLVASSGPGALTGGPWLSWFENAGRIVRGLFWHGDESLRNNLPGRAFLDPIQAALVAAGLVTAATQLDRMGDAESRNRWAFLALWLFVMLTPSLFSDQAPHFGRLAGAAPPLAIFAGAGAETLRQKVQSRTPRSVSVLFVGSLLVVSSALTIRDYFGRYASHPELGSVFDLEAWQLGRFAAQYAADRDLYLTPSQAEMATLYFALEGSQQLHSFTSTAGALPLGRPGRAPLYLVREDDRAGLDELARRLPGAQVGDEVAGATPVLVTAPVTESEPVGTWAGAIALSDWEVERAGTTLALTLRWQALADLQRDYTAYVHLVDAAGNVVVQTDRPPAGYPTSDWRRHEWVEDRFQVELPAELPAGSYTLQTGFYYLPTLEPLGAPVALGEPLTFP